MSRLTLVAVIGFAITGAAKAQEARQNGLAAKYPGDKGLASDPAVLFADGFESGNLDLWSKQERRGTPTITSDERNLGRNSVAMPMVQGRSTGAKLVVWFPPGADRVYCRFYVKFSKDFRYAHHFVTLLASDPRERYKAFGKAGLKPDGTYFTVAMEPWFAWGRNEPPGEINLYTYYPDMEMDRKMNKYWGNAFFPPGPGKGKAAGEKKVIPKLGEWQCWEFMVVANSAPDKADGKQAMWLDGRLAGEFTGLRFRTDSRCKVHCLWLELFGYDGGDPTRQYWKQSQTVWFDDVVVAKEYVGPARRQ
jgi:hypothetical protein